MATLALDLNSADDYRTFLAVKSLPVYQCRGRELWFPDEYADRIGIKAKPDKLAKYSPHPKLFDYQSAIAAMAIRKKKFACFADCGLGKTLILLEFAKAARENNTRRGVLIVSPLMVIPQTIAEAQRFYGANVTIEHVRGADLAEWLANCAGKIGITNYESLCDDLPQGQLGCLIVDESSMLKSHYGKWGQCLIKLGAGLEYKLCLTGTPAPNDRIEYANHAVFLDQFPTVNAFLATYFVNRGQTEARWELKPHALRPFYRALSHWCIFLTNPATYGWKDNCETIPPIHVHMHNVPMTPEQGDIVRKHTGKLVPTQSGGITTRGALGQIAKGFYKGTQIPTNKPAFIRDLIRGWSTSESTLVWCIYDHEQDAAASALPDSASMSGKTKQADRQAMIDAFKSGECRTLISKPKILGFGLNLQVATRQVFSGLQDSYENYYQAVKRSNRYGATMPLNVHIPFTDIEAPMIDNVLRKAARVQQDCEEQEQLFKECGYVG